MVKKLDESDTVSFQELLMANTMQVDALAQILIEKGFFTEQEFYKKLKDVQLQYDRAKAEKD